MVISPPDAFLPELIVPRLRWVTTTIRKAGRRWRHADLLLLTACSTSCRPIAEWLVLLGLLLKEKVMALR